MISLRSLISLLPFLSGDRAQKRQIGPDGTYTTSLTTLYTAIAAYPSNAPLEPASTRCYSPGNCIDFSYPVVILQPSSVKQAVCPSDNQIIITFKSHSAFVKAQSWPMANLVLVGQGYPGCGPGGGSKGTRFYAITQSTTAHPKSRSISARVVYVARNDVAIGSSSGNTIGTALTTTTFTIKEQITVNGIPTTAYSTVTETLTLLPTLVPPTPQSSTVPESSLKPPLSSSLVSSSPPSIVEPSYTSASHPASASTLPKTSSNGDGCLTDSTGFFTDDFGITYLAQCNFWTGGVAIANFGPGYSAEDCLESCSMIFPGCGAAVFDSDGGYCALQEALGSVSRVRFGLHTYERVTEHVGTNTTLESPISSVVSETASSESTTISGGFTPSEATSSESVAGPDETDSIVMQPSSSNINAGPSTLPTILPFLRASCPAANNQLFSNQARQEYFRVECNKIAAAPNAGPWLQATNIAECAAACTGACDGFQYGFGNCAIYTGVTAMASSSSWTVATIVPTSLATLPSESAVVTLSAPAISEPLGESGLPDVPLTSGSPGLRPGSSSVALPGASTVVPSSVPSLPTSTAPPCPGSDNGIYVDSNGQTYDVHCGHTLVARFISAMYYVETDADCVELCHQTEGCEGASHNVAYYNACLLYSDVQATSATNAQVNVFILAKPSTSVSQSPPAVPSPSVPAAASVACPSSDRSIFTDPTDSRRYEIFCDSLLTSPAGEFSYYRNIRGRLSFSQCAALCNTGVCPGFVYSGTSNACGIYAASNVGMDFAIPKAVTAITLASAIATVTSLPALSDISSSAGVLSIELSTSEYISGTIDIDPIPTSMSSVAEIDTSSPSEPDTTDVPSSIEVDLSMTDSFPPVPTSTSQSLCPFSNNIPFTDLVGNTYDVVCNTDLPGGDLGQPLWGITSEQTCLKACDDQPGCVGVVIGSEGCSNGWCHGFLKDVIEPGFTNANYNSFVKVPGENIPNMDDDNAITSGNPSIPSPTAIQLNIPSTPHQASVMGEPITDELPSPESMSLPFGDETAVSTSVELRNVALPSGSAQASISITCPDADGTLYTGADGRLFTIGCDRDLRLTYTGRSVQPDFVACLTACDAQGPLCCGISWVESGQDEQWCWYKTGEENWSSPPQGITVWSAKVVGATTTPDCPTSNGTIYTGSDGTHFEIYCDMDLRGSGINKGLSIQSSLQACLDTCDGLGKSQCYGISYVPQGQLDTFCYYKAPEDPWVAAPPGITVYSARVVEDSS